MTSFWTTLPKPFFVQAPLANVTDAAFRRMIAQYSKPHGPQVMYTEFVSADGLMRGNKDILLKDLLFTNNERPIVAQFFTSNPDAMEEAARLAAALGFDGVDINMGCPDKAVEKQGAGAALIKNPDQAVLLIEAAKKGAGSLPVSIKTRIGYNKDTLEEWLPVLLSAAPAAVVVHARTRKEMSLVPAHWDRVQRAVAIRDGLKSSTLIVGNGDATSIEDARLKVKESGADGVMLGRALFGTPWLFNEAKEINVEERLRITIEHAELFEELLGGVKHFALMKKHFKSYVEGFPGAKELRVRLMETSRAAEVSSVINEFLSGMK